MQVLLLLKYGCGFTIRWRVFEWSLRTEYRCQCNANIIAKMVKCYVEILQCSTVWFSSQNYRIHIELFQMLISEKVRLNVKFVFCFDYVKHRKTSIENTKTSSKYSYDVCKRTRFWCSLHHPYRDPYKLL